jgi:predicted methyltransferase
LRKVLPIFILLSATGNALLNKAVADAASEAIAAAIADPTRPPTDTSRDANRKPAETLTFAGVKPGDKIGDYAAGAGYFTRLFAGVAGPKGHVYASVPSALLQYPNIVKGIAELQKYAVGHPNVSVNFASAIDAARYPEKLDLFWISQNYHDLKDPFMGPVDMAAFNRAVYEALKPGGIYIVLDHVAAPGSPDNVTDTLHPSSPPLYGARSRPQGSSLWAKVMSWLTPMILTLQVRSMRRSKARPTNSSSNFESPELGTLKISRTASNLMRRQRRNAKVRGVLWAGQREVVG